MSEPLRPAPGIAPGAFFESWLPTTLAVSGRVPAPDAPPVRVTLWGAGGGEWLVCPDPDGVVVTPGPVPRSAEVGVWIRQSTLDFAATFAPDVDLPELLPASWSALDLLFLDARDVSLVRQMAGRILIEIAGRRRRRWALDAAFGKEGLNAGRPRATVQIDGTTYDGLRTGALAPMQALLAGKVKVEGDRALAGKALMLTAARLSRR